MTEIAAARQWQDNWQDLPAAASAEQAEAGRVRWLEAVANGDYVSELEAIADSPSFDSLLNVLFGNSRFLTHCAIADPATMLRIMYDGPRSVFDETIKNLRGSVDALAGHDDVSRLLRQARRQIALTVAVADITGVWALDEVTQALTDFADQALSTALRHLISAAADRGELNLPDPDNPEIGSGLIILGMGKHGAGELNYSSDIDLIVLFDPEVTRTDRPAELSQCFVKITQSLVKLMSDRTEDGYVARLDLRLRPDPASTPVAMSTLAAETYYESIGQNWERAAMIKARPVAGDRDAGNEFLARLAPFIWRKNLDFATIQDIHAVKRQIYAQHGGAEIDIPGHNVKLGRGGIREVEFFAQTQQLIWGGRLPELRGRRTCDTLAKLADAGQISDDAAHQLETAYHYLRRLEHRLQMIDDQQTHTMPEDTAGLDALAAFMGNSSRIALENELGEYLQIVEGHYAALFEEAPSLTSGQSVEGNLIFTGVEDDPSTLETLSSLGFQSPKVVSATVREWHRGRYASTQSDRARQLLTELMPALLVAFGRTPTPDFAFGKFDEALSRLPFGIQLFSLFHAKPDLLTLVAEVMGTAPRLAEHLSRYPAVLEGVLSVDLSAPPSPLESLQEECSEALQRAVDYEDVLDIARRWSNDQKFQRSIHILRHTLKPRLAAEGLSDIAEAVVAALLPQVETAFAAQYGRVKDSAMAIVAMGKLGGREMTPTSDLDLVIIYDHDSDARQSDGERSLDVSTYYARLSQRMINAITALTPAGRLYEVDMRLRPSGNSGPIASTLDAFTRYHENTAWTWEHMALTRARVVAGPERLGDRIEQVISKTLQRERPEGALYADVADMRQRIDAEHHSDFVWEVKYIRGGLVDIEFITQTLQLQHAMSTPSVLKPNTSEALQALEKAGILSAGDAKTLILAHMLWQTIQAMLRLTIEGYFVPGREDEIPDALQQALLNATQAPDMPTL